MKVIAGFLGLAIAAAIWQFRAHFPFDDTFISFRYAEHVASGHGLVWNIGGPHTEGYTNLLFILLLSAARFLTSDLLAASQFLGLVSTIITGVIIYSIAQDARGKHTGLIAIAFFWLTPLTWINAMSGMETSLFVMLSALAILLAIRNRFFEAYAAAFLATLTRPEGALLGIIIFIVAIGFSHQPGTLLLRTLKSTATKAAVAFVMALALYALWKWWYFGELLPNSFYVKVLSTSHVLFPGLQYVRLFAVSALVLIALSLGIRGWRTRVVAATGVWTVLLLVFYCFVLPLEGLYDRFLWPAFSMLCVMAAIGLRDFSEWRTLRLSLVFAIVLVLHLSVSMLSPRTKQSLAAREEIWDASMDPVVNVLRQLPHRDSLRFAYGDAGYVIYKSGIHHIDLFGLNDTRIAHARSVSEREAIVDSEQPDILLLPIHSRDSCEDWVEDAYGLARTKDFEPIVSSEAFPFTLVWLLNVNSPYYEECKLTLLRNLKASENHLHPVPILCYSTR